MNGTHDPVLVVLSVLVAVFAAYTALELAMSVRAARGRSRLLWLWCGALAMGTGLWSVHFVGMLAAGMPYLPIEYDVPRLFLSIGAAVIASATMLWAVSRPAPQVASLLAAAILTGVLLCGMHYIGIWSIHTDGGVGWNPGRVAASFGAGILASLALVWVAFRLRDDDSARAAQQRRAGGLLVGGGLALMHYVAVSASQFAPGTGPVQVRSEDMLATEGLALVIAAAALMLLIIAVVGSIFERELERRTQLAEENRLLYERAQAAQEAAESANRAKSQFLANMSHELRTPLNAIVGYAQLLEMGLGGQPTEAQLNHLARIRSSSEHLLRLIEDILDLSRMEAGHMAVRRERAHLASTVGAAVTMLQPQLSGSRQRLELECADPDLLFFGDAARLEQIVINLLGNASKFTGEGGHIAVVCEQVEQPDAEATLSGSGPWLAVRVVDTGIGIHRDDLESLFRPFMQLDAELTRKRGGTGLGLAISRDLARRMGGDITVRSELGKGSTFTVWLPAATAAPEEYPPAETLMTMPAVHHPEAFRLVGQTLPSLETAILAGYVTRMRQDDGIPRARLFSTPQLEDHAASFLADIAQSLVLLEDPNADLSMLRDGSDIQRVISQLHGAQRARLGWTLDALEREFLILREEIEAALHSAMPTPAPEGVDSAFDVLRQLLRQARAISLRGFNAAPPGEGRLGN